MKVLLISFNNVSGFSGNSGKEISEYIEHNSEHKIEHISFEFNKNLINNYINDTDFKDYDFILILSMSSKSTCITIEQYANNGKNSLNTQFPVKNIFRSLLRKGYPVKLSNNAGKNISEFVYYKFLEKLPDRVLLLNIPLTSKSNIFLIKKYNKYFPYIKTEEANKIIQYIINFKFNEPLFFCDSMLKGLVKKLRFSGIYAEYNPKNDINKMLEYCFKNNLVLLSSNTKLFKYNYIKNSIVEFYFLDNNKQPDVQLKNVFTHFNLKLKNPRCSLCNTEIVRINKNKIIDRIPKKTGQWLDEFYICKNCNKIYWKGTHWINLWNKLKNKI